MVQPIEMPERSIKKKKVQIFTGCAVGTTGRGESSNSLLNDNVSTIMANLHHITTIAYLSIVVQALMTTWWLLPARQGAGKAQTMSICLLKHDFTE